MPDLVEEPLDPVARTIEVRAEADGLPTIAFGRNVGPRTLFINKGLIQSVSASTMVEE
jgi:hypothetical protein